MQRPDTPTVEALEHEIWRIDTAYVAPGTAACYLIKDGDEYALIEAGTGLSVRPILEALASLNVARERLRFVIPTHVHLDHAGGVGGLMRALPNARLYVHPRGLRHMIDPGRLLAGAQAVYGAEAFARANGEILSTPQDRAFAAEDGCRLQLGTRTLELRDAPGHARHHLVVWDARSKGFFTGDVFGLCYPQLEAGGRPFIVPTTTPVQFDPEAWQQTLQMMQSYAPMRMYLTHYGAVGDVERLGGELANRVEEHAALGRQHANLSEEDLARVLGDALYAHYRTQGGGLERAAFNQVLQMDLALNAQGLLHWQQQA